MTGKKNNRRTRVLAAVMLWKREGKAGQGQGRIVNDPTEAVSKITFPVVLLPAHDKKWSWLIIESSESDPMGP